ncbi:uncharacterized protein ColSpa_00837 [Colletotrichum spaethianum]|uniref:Uncharacterized protein n=1 Tax=Colletotrichum spaethianum TaxID=700344 RepID=A0AA37P4A2_9PEZI|nr:uncharacterized protein ColSpa_00837 [Colletotrichum spaethianum]GKT40656.1 hypothetical protein ColSpa_00837 [Colletotrichum spaethianum]
MALVRGEIQIRHALQAQTAVRLRGGKPSQIDTQTTVPLLLSVDTSSGFNGDSTAPSLDIFVVPPTFSEGLAIRRHRFIVVCLWGEDRYMYTAETTPMPQPTRAKVLGFPIVLTGFRIFEGQDRYTSERGLQG